jgi:hypothetical protein
MSLFARPQKRHLPAAEAVTNACQGFHRLLASVQTEPDVLELLQASATSEHRRAWCTYFIIPHSSYIRFYVSMIRRPTPCHAAPIMQTKRNNSNATQNARPGHITVGKQTNKEKDQTHLLKRPHHPRLTPLKIPHFLRMTMRRHRPHRVPPCRTNHARRDTPHSHITSPILHRIIEQMIIL